MKVQTFKYSILFSLFFLVACGNRDSNNSNSLTSAPTTSGIFGVYNSKTVGATCTLKDTNGLLITTKVTGNDGFVTFSEPTISQGVLVLTCSGGSYIDEATGNSINPAPTLNAALLYEGGKLNMIATPLSEIAYQLAKEEGGFAHISKHNANVADNFGLDGIDIIRVKPNDLNDDAVGDNDSGKFGLVLSAVSQLAQMNAKTPVDTIDALVKDMKDSLTQDIIINAIRTLKQSNTEASINANNSSEAENSIVLDAGVSAPKIKVSRPTLIAQAGTGIQNITVNSVGGEVAKYSITPAMANGLVFNTTTGTISGTPKKSASLIHYFISATNQKATDTVAVSITINTTTKEHRFLEKCTFGPTEETIQELRNQSEKEWIDAQVTLPSAYDNTHDNYLTYLERTIAIEKMARPNDIPYTIAEYVDKNNAITFGKSPNSYGTTWNAFQSVWFENALNAKDQLRHRVAFALSQIVVVSNTETAFHHRGEALAYYYDILTKNAFGNYQDLLYEITKSPAMGIYLTYAGSKKYNPETLSQPDENYARELMQLFSIGLNELNMDGTLKLDSFGKPIQSYQQSDIEILSKVFTGWNLSSQYKTINILYSDLTKDMEFFSEYHDYSEKNFLGSSIASGKTGDEDIKAAINILMQNKNMAPFISKQLIKRLVTSNPTPAYVSRVSHVFENNGHGVKGDLKAVVRAILLDTEALGEHPLNSNFGKIKEPLIAYTQLLRTFHVTYAHDWDAKALDSHGSGNTMKNVYLFKNDLQWSFGQSPVEAKNVFNFYNPQYTPNDNYFKTNSLSAPELEIQSAQILINYSNRILHDISTYEELRENEYGNKQSGFYDRFLITFKPESEIIINKMQNNLSNINNSTYKKEAVNALVDYLNVKLVNLEFSDEQLAALKNYLNTTRYASNISGVRQMIIIAVSAMATSDKYMFQR